MASLHPVRLFLRSLTPPRRSLTRPLLNFSTSARSRIEASIGASSSNASASQERSAGGLKRRRIKSSHAATSRGPPVPRTSARRQASIPTQARHIELSPVEDATKPLPYHVLRTPSQQLPVYRDVKRGGTLEQTIIRKISGDLAALRNDVQSLLNLPRDYVVANTISRQVVVKGFYKEELTRFLESKRF